MPIKEFVCVSCTRWHELMLPRHEYDKKTTIKCVECGGTCKAVLSVPSKRNPQYGIQK